MDLEAVLRHEAFAALRAVKLGRAVGSDVQLQPPLRGAGPLAYVASVPDMFIMDFRCPSVIIFSWNWD